MDNTRAGWYNLEVVEGLGAPLKELEALSVSGKFKKLILLLGIGGSGGVNLHGVVDDKIDGAEWVDLRWVSAKTLHGITHRSEVNDSWNSTKMDTGWLMNELLIDTRFTLLNSTVISIVIVLRT